MRLRHQKHQAGVARGLVKRGSEVDQRVAGIILFDQPGCPDLQRLDFGRIRRENFADKPLGAILVPCGLIHAGQGNFDPTAVFRVFDRSNNGLKLGNPLVAAAGIEFQ